MTSGSWPRALAVGCGRAAGARGGVRRLADLAADRRNADHPGGDHGRSGDGCGGRHRLPGAEEGAGRGLGNRTNRPEAEARGAEANRGAADAFAANVLPVVRELQTAGVTTARAIADALNARGIHTARGCDWHHSTVRNLLTRRAVERVWLRPEPDIRSGLPGTLALSTDVPQLGPAAGSAFGSAPERSGAPRAVRRRPA